MPVINKLIQKIRTCGLQNPPTRSVPGRGYFLCIYHSGFHCLVIPHRDAVSGHTALDAVSRKSPGWFYSIFFTDYTFNLLLDPASGCGVTCRVIPRCDASSGHSALDAESRNMD